VGRRTILIDSYDITPRFRWVFCQLEILRRTFPPSVQRILEELPESLDGTYERVLEEIGKANQRHAHRMMQCLVVAIRPLRVEELAEVLAVDFDSGVTAMLNPDWRWPDQERAVMSACSSLISIVNDGDSRVVQFSHFSVKEFLMSRRLAESSQDISRYHISLEPAHTILAQACLGVLLRLDDSTKSYPLARYAARYWVNHAQFEKVSSQIEEGMDCLFDADKPHFAIWLWIYNHDNPGHNSLSSQPSQPESLAVPLYYAALLGFRDLAERLIIKYPEDVNAKGGYEVTPLHASADRGHTRVLSLLIGHFPDICIRGVWGQTPLHRAARQGHLEIEQQLLSRSASVNALDDDGWTPLHSAAMHGQVEFARVLLGYKALIDAQTNRGKSPLHLASIFGHVELVTLLLERGADPNARDKNARTPSQVVSRRKRHEIVKLLSEYGAESVQE
jgi:ankyrin repeat protein